MAAMLPAASPRAQVVNLVNDSDPDSPAYAPAAPTPNFDHDVAAMAPGQGRARHPHVDLVDVFFDDYDHGFGDPHRHGQADEPEVIIGGSREVPLIIDDFSYLDDDDEDDGAEMEPRQQGSASNACQDFQNDFTTESSALFTADDCLQRVLELFPDVSHEHVKELYRECGEEDDDESIPGQARLDSIVDELLSNPSYPKQCKPSASLKRKREASVDLENHKRWESDDRDALPNFLLGSMRAMLKAEFPEFPISSVNQTLSQEKYLYKAYLRLTYLRDTALHARRGRPSSHFASANTIAAKSGWPALEDELVAARKRVENDRAARVAEAARKKAEADNLQAAIDAGQTAECQACFDDLPMNRQIHCSGDTAHFTCYSCAEAYIKSEVGESRCRVLCTAGCGANFAPHQLNLLSDKTLLHKLAQLQQEKDIRDAGLEDLEECPFCEYKAILPPVEEDFEFRCANPTCEKVSCRRCRALSHIPISCEQHAKENKLSSRHKIEEAMTAALVRSCNKCKKHFIKDYGCNKMSCPSCGNMQCYVCSQTLKDYNHFDQRPAAAAAAAAASRTASGSAKCPLYDNVEDRHEREVKAAEEAARADVIASNPDVAPEDLQIKVPDAVRQSAPQHHGQHNGPEGLAGGFYGWAGPGIVGAPGNPHLNAQRHRFVEAAADMLREGQPAGGRQRGLELLREHLRNVRAPAWPPLDARDAVEQLREVELFARDFRARHPPPARPRRRDEAPLQEVEAWRRSVARDDAPAPAPEMQEPREHFVRRRVPELPARPTGLDGEQPGPVAGGWWDARRQAYERTRPQPRDLSADEDDEAHLARAAARSPPRRYQEAEYPPQDRAHARTRAAVRFPIHVHDSPPARDAPVQPYPNRPAAVQEAPQPPFAQPLSQIGMPQMGYIPVYGFANFQPPNPFAQAAATGRPQRQRDWEAFPYDEPAPRHEPPGAVQGLIDLLDRQRAVQNRRQLAHAHAQERLAQPQGQAQAQPYPLSRHHMARNNNNNNNHTPPPAIAPALLRKQDNPFAQTVGQNFDLEFRDPFNNSPALRPRVEEPGLLDARAGAGVRQTRQGFEQLEMMRREHDERMGLGIRPLDRRPEREWWEQ